MGGPGGDDIPASSASSCSLGPVGGGDVKGSWKVVSPGSDRGESLPAAVTTRDACRIT